MKTGTASETAAIVCMGRAIAHERTAGVAFSDPTAMALLSTEQQEEVQRVRQGPRPKELRARFRYEHLMKESHLMVARTLAIDADLISTNAPQAVILGAGLDGRAWRMPELKNTVVFEVDHPDSQSQKRQRAAPLLLKARDVRFVPLDFQTGDLSQALKVAGHDSHLPTAWIWEGVVMYLTRPEIETTLSTIEARSAPGSRLIVAYLQPALILVLLAMIVRRLGEPIRTVLTPHQMRTLLDRHGFHTLRDRSLPDIGFELSSEIGRTLRAMRHSGSLLQIGFQPVRDSSSNRTPRATSLLNVKPVIAPRASRVNFTMPAASPTNTSFEKGTMVMVEPTGLLSINLESSVSSVYAQWSSSLRYSPA